jgi:hypothetical protein
MSTRNKAAGTPPVPAAAKESPRERHDRMLLEISSFMAAIDAALAECTATMSGVAAGQ